MKITSFGLFWRESEIDWNPGSGNRDSFRLLGRIGANSSTLRICDFRRQEGIYILYDDYGPYYVGLTRALGLGQRLKNHTADRHAGKWDRFSWFGFRSISEKPDKTGVRFLEAGVDQVTSSKYTTIGDLEALLIAAIGAKSNRSKMKFADAHQWIQIDYDDFDKYLRRL
jgi:hypothetical protein